MECGGKEALQQRNGREAVRGGRGDGSFFLVLKIRGSIVGVMAHIYRSIIIIILCKWNMSGNWSAGDDAIRKKPRRRAKSVPDKCNEYK